MQFITFVFLDYGNVWQHLGIIKVIGLLLEFISKSHTNYDNQCIIFLGICSIMQGGIRPQNYVVRMIVYVLKMELISKV